METVSFEEALKYFGDCDQRYVDSFIANTPKGNNIQGYICKKPNKYMGSLLITHVNGDSVLQYVHSMPKINSFKDYKDISASNICHCYEKLDGTCLIVYPLKDKNGDIIEIIAKTRNMPVADRQFQQLFDKLDKRPFHMYYSENDGVLIFELYGMLNKHNILYYNTGLDIRFIAEFKDNEMNTDLTVQLTDYGFKKPEELFIIGKYEDKWIIIVPYRIYNHYNNGRFKNYLNYRDTYKYDTFEEAVLGIQLHLEDLNNEYIRVNGINAVEGVVINMPVEDGILFIKCKPKSISSGDGITGKSIRKEVYKYFDEYGSCVGEIYSVDRDHHTEYIVRMLAEEFSIDQIYNARKRIEKIFMDVWDSKVSPIDIDELCDKLIRENPDKSISDLMRIFSSEYPQKKSKSRLVYTVLNDRLGE